MSKLTLKNTIKESNYEHIEFQILFSDSFKRMANKTQVYSNSNGSNGHRYRTRLSHSIEVGQLSFYVCKALGLNPILGRLFGYAHDIGHAPFGHLGQDILNQIMVGYGEFFEHNHQAERTLTIIESIELPPEIKYGLLKNKKVSNSTIDTTKQPVVECQVTDICDSIAYLSGDIEDALKFGHIDFKDICKKNEFLKELLDNKKYINNSNKENIEYIHDLILNYFSDDLINQSFKNMSLIKSDKKDISILLSDENIISLTYEKKKELKKLKQYMYENLYLSKFIRKHDQLKTYIINFVFEEIANNTEKLLPQKYISRYETNECTKERSVCDYIAGCDDKFINELYKELCFNRNKL